MKQKRHTTEEIIRILWEADQGKSTEALCREHNVTMTSYYRWKKKYGGMELQDARRYRELERENGEFKKIVARAVEGVMRTGLCSQRRACRYLGLHRSSSRYE
jgi:putative transposase